MILMVAERPIKKPIKIQVVVDRSEARGYTVINDWKECMNTSDIRRKEAI
jgi:hypothetical protein